MKKLKNTQGNICKIQWMRLNAGQVLESKNKLEVHDFELMTSNQLCFDRWETEDTSIEQGHIEYIYLSTYLLTGHLEKDI